MRNVFALLTALLFSVLVSGCALIGKHTAAVEGGTKTTMGILTFDKIDNGYPLLPLYSGFKQD
ncbi:MAG: hypothetical protein PHU80_01015 [Kiritimatiellae bacterium]|nr:hypothetical protein [Kiritimatiellia bacterium]